MIIESTKIIPLSHVIYSQYFEEEKISLIERISHTFEKYFSILFPSLILIVFFSGDLLFSIFLPNYFNLTEVLTAISRIKEIEKILQSRKKFERFKKLMKDDKEFENLDNYEIKWK